MKGEREKGREKERKRKNKSLSKFLTWAWNSMVHWTVIPKGAQIKTTNIPEGIIHYTIM